MTRPTRAQAIEAVDTMRAIDNANANRIWHVMSQAERNAAHRRCAALREAVRLLEKESEDA